MRVSGAPRLRLIVLGVCAHYLATAPGAFGATILYALTKGGLGEGQIYRSVDSAKTWRLTAMSGVALAVDPQNPNIVYSMARSSDKKTTSTGGPAVLRSTDGGQTFTASSFNGIGPIVVDSSAGNILYVQAAGQGGLWRSTDSGNTWNLSNAGGVISVRTDPAAPGVVFAIMQTPTNPRKLDRSNDYGATWTAVAGLQGTAYDIAFDGKNPNTLYIGGNGSCGATGTACSLPRSTDGGKTWQGPGPPGTFGNVVIDPRNGNIFAGGVLDPNGKRAGIVVKSSDGGKTWTTFSNGLRTHGAQVHVDPESPSILYANQWSQYIDINSAAVGVFVSTDGGQSWTLSPVDPEPNPGVVISAYEVISFQAVSDKAVPLAISNVVSGASFQSGIVPNSWVTISGSSLAAQTDDWSKSVVNGRLPTTLDDVSVSMGGKPAYVYFVSPTQLNVLAPDLPPGPVPVTVTTARGVSSSFTTTATQYGPAFFTWPGNQPVATRQDFSFAVKAGTFAGATTVAAKPGDVLILWGTGFGPTNPAAPTGVAVPAGAVYATTTNPAVTINGVAATFFGSVLSPGSAGLYQIAIQVPNTLADGDWPIQASIGGVQSPGGVLLSVKR